MNSNPALEYMNNNLGQQVGGSGRVTIDSVVQKTFMTLGLLMLTGFATWFYFGNLIASQDYNALNQLYAFSGVASLSALGLSFWIAFSQKTRPGVILVFSALEGVTLGAFSKVAEVQAGVGAPVGALIGTVIAFGAVLGFYKFINGNISQRFIRITTMLAFGFVMVSIADLVLSIFATSLGLNGFGPLGFVFSLIGFGLAVAMLLSDFKLVENAITYGLPEKESWRLAYGLTVTLVWLYVNLLRMIVSLRNLADN